MLQPDQGLTEKEYYKIKDVADFIGVPQSTLRFWEQEFPELRPMRSPKGRRYYTPDDISLLRLIHYLVRVRGMRLEAARKQIAGNRANITQRLRILDKLREVRDDLISIRSALDKRRDT